MPKGHIVIIGLGKPPRGASQPPRLGKGRPSGKAPGVPMMEHGEPDADDMPAPSGGAVCPHCGSPLSIGPGGR